ncbi:MAG: RES family NAD+ phosphorylase [Pseudomonadota bacterium]
MSTRFRFTLPPTNPVRWRPSWRLVPSHFPPVGIFDRVAGSDDLEAVQYIEGLTNERLREETGDISLVPEADRIFGPGTTPIMAAFTHRSPHGSRFSDGSFGVYYAAHHIDTAIAETAYHRARFLRATNESPIEIDMRSYAADLDGQLHDLRGASDRYQDVYAPSPNAYHAGQSLAATLRSEGSDGIAYDSVRHEGGECVAVFKPRLLRPTRQGPHFCYVWDGQQIASIHTKSHYRSA